MSADAWGVMVSHADGAGSVHTRLWMVSKATAEWIAGQLGAPTMEQVQTHEQAQAGAEAGRGAVIYPDHTDGDDADRAHGAQR